MEKLLEDLDIATAMWWQTGRESIAEGYYNIRKEQKELLNEINAIRKRHGLEELLFAPL